MNALITGASRGIGAATARALAAKGYNLLLCARNMSGLEALAKELHGINPNVSLYLVEADCGKKADCEEVAKRALREWERVDVLVNNVGMYAMGLFTQPPDGAMEEAIETILISAYRISRAIAPSMMEARTGHIFNICSVLSREIRPEAAAYTVSKQALYALSKVMSAELREHNVQVTAVLPGSVNTSSWDGIEAPTAEFVQPEDIANILLTVLEASPGALFDEIVVRPVRKDF